MVDIFWEALRHSPFFQNADISFKRSLCLHMVSEFHLPGDFIFKAGEHKNRMVYIVTGEIQLLSNEDHESPFLSLSGGTLLGETCVLCAHVSKVSIRCDTFCEMQVLDIKSLCSVLLEYRSVTKYLHKRYQKRIDYAKWASSDLVPKYDPAIDGSEKMTTVMKLKKQWKFIASHHKRKKTEINWGKVDRSFTSTYLNTLVIAESIKLKRDVICLQSQCPFVIDPDSVSITATELISIHYDTFMDIFQSYHNEHMFLQNALREHMAQFDSILMRRGCRLPEMKSTKESLGRVKTFKYKVDASKRKQRYTERDINANAVKSLGSWRFLRFFLLRNSIDPKSTIYVTWEIFRCISILLEVTMCIISITLPTTFNREQILYAFRVVGLIDIYVRLHCQYYNAQGIAVKHPLYTAQKYIESSFIVDLIASLPVGIIWVRHSDKHTRAGLVVSTMAQLILRPLLLYRVFHGLTYMQKKLYSTGAAVVLKTKATIMVFVILGFLTNVLLFATCTFDSNFRNCTNAQYIQDSVFYGSYKITTAFLQALYFNVEGFTHSVSGVFGVESNKEITYFLIIECILYCLRCLILALYTSSEIGGNINLSTHQARMKQFISFANDLLLEENLTKAVVDHYEHVWKETLGTSINVISSKFNLYLRIQFVCFLYEGSLRRTKLFAFAPTAIIQRLAPCLREVHFRRRGTVIRCNDVQKNLYFVHKGEVDITVANTVLTTLGVGGLFGCFHKGGTFRQTFTATSMTHTILLALDSIKLQEIIAEWDDKHTEKVLKQIRTCQQRLILSKHLRWSYLIYWTMFRLQLMANMWFLVSCLDHNCYYIKERFGRPKTVSPTMNFTDSALVGYTYTVNIFSTTGMRDTVPTNWKELIVSAVMALFAQFMVANMASGFANMVIIDKNTLAKYQHKINKMKIFLSGRYLSPALLNKAWEYYILLWKLQKGECLPTLITEAPSYLKQDVMLYLFGYHLENHFLFAKTHKDFIRQLVTLFERRVYLPGNVIVEKGDVDDTMYFVHSGEVGAFDRQGTDVIQVFVVKSDMSFGEAQGLYNIPYKMTYKAVSVTFVLALRKSVWEYLLKWFPASQETIMQQAVEYNIRGS
ncbi:hypothetical protein Trydic_g16604 [Trypoxylus dichotomus]